MVTEICTEASNEAKNEIEISNIEQVWKGTNFELSNLIKGGEETYILKSNEDVKQLLEDQLTNLQQVASSKYVAAFLKRVRHWEQALNRISETIEMWFIVQKKWIYLEGIFTGSDDIRQQLRDEARKFDKNDKFFKKFIFYYYLIIYSFLITFTNIK